MGLSIGHIAVIIIGCFAVAIISISFIPLRRKKRLERNSNKNNKQNKTEIKVSLDKECVNSRIEFTSYDKDVKQRKLQNLYHASEKRIEMIKKIRAPPIVDGNAGSKNDGEKIDATSNVSQKNINTSGSAVKKIDPEGETVTELTSKPIDKDTTIDATSNVSQKPESVSNPKISDPKTHKKSYEVNHPRFFEESKGGARSKEPTMVDSSVGSTFIPIDELAIEEREEKNKKKSQEELRSKEKEDRERKRQMQNDNISDGSYTGFYPSKESSKSDQNLNSDRMYALKMQEEWNNEIKNSSKHTTIVGQYSGYIPIPESAPERKFDTLKAVLDQEEIHVDDFELTRSIYDFLMSAKESEFEKKYDEHMEEIETALETYESKKRYKFKFNVNTWNFKPLQKNIINKDEYLKILLNFVDSLKLTDGFIIVEGVFVLRFLRHYKTSLQNARKSEHYRFNISLMKMDEIHNLFKLVLLFIHPCILAGERYDEPSWTETSFTFPNASQETCKTNSRSEMNDYDENIEEKFMQKSGNDLKDYLNEHFAMIEDSYRNIDGDRLYSLNCELECDVSSLSILISDTLNENEQILIEFLLDLKYDNHSTPIKGEHIRNFLKAYKNLLTKPDQPDWESKFKEDFNKLLRFPSLFKVVAKVISVTKQPTSIRTDFSSMKISSGTKLLAQPTLEDQIFQEIRCPSISENIYDEFMGKEGNEFKKYFKEHLERIHNALAFYKTNHKYKFTNRPFLSEECHIPSIDSNDGDSPKILEFIINFSDDRMSNYYNGNEIKEFLRAYNNLLISQKCSNYLQPKESVRYFQRFTNFFRILGVILSVDKSADAFTSDTSSTETPFSITVTSEPTFPPALDKPDRTVDKQREERKKARESAERKIIKVGNYKPEYDIAKVLTTAIGKGVYSKLCFQYFEMINKVLGVFEAPILYVFVCDKSWPLVDLQTCSYDRDECESVKNIINSMNEVYVAEHQVEIFGRDINQILNRFSKMLEENMNNHKEDLKSTIKKLEKIPNYFIVIYLFLECMPNKKRKKNVLRPSNVDLSEDTSKFMFPKLTESSVGANESSQKLSECDKESVV